jgi:hypothetical protein
MTEPAEAGVRTDADARSDADARPEADARPDDRAPAAPAAGARFADLRNRPVAEHVGLFEAEHDRLQRELGTIDQL